MELEELIILQEAIQYFQQLQAQVVVEVDRVLTQEQLEHLEDQVEEEMEIIFQLIQVEQVIHHQLIHHKEIMVEPVVQVDRQWEVEVEELLQ